MEGRVNSIWITCWTEPPPLPDTKLSLEVNVFRNVERDMTVSKPAGLILNDGK